MARSKYELKADKELKADGFTTDYKCRPYRVPKGYKVDYFGLFDVLAIKDGQLRCIAIKGHQGVPGVLRKGITNWQPTEIIKEIWTYRDDGTIRKEVI